MAYYRINNDIEIFYKIIPQKNNNKENEKIILINGLGSPIPYWLDFPEHLSTNFEVLIYDNRGIGKSSDSPKFYTVEDLAMDLFYLIKFLKWNSFHLLGISLGGFIALKFLEKFLNDFEVKSLLLFSTHPGLKHLYYPLHNPFLEFIKWKFLPKEQRIEEIIKYNSGSNLKKTNPELYNKLLESRRKEKVELNKSFWQQTWAGSTFLGINYKKIKSPVLIIHGKNDKVVPYQNAYILEKLLINSNKKNIKIYEDAGHLCLWEKEKEVLYEIHQFLLNSENQKSFIKMR